MNSAVVAAAFGAVLVAAAGIQLVTVRHEARAERIARCEADVARARQQASASVEKLSRLFAGGGPNAACELAAALATRGHEGRER